MKRVLMISLMICLSDIAYTQKNGLHFQVKLPIQYEIQKADENFSYDTIIRKGSGINFGLDALIQYKRNRFSINTGVGYFRNRFNIKRGYDHMALNPTTDSLPIGTETSRYTYSIIRIPVGFAFEISKFRGYKIGLGCEYFFNYSFRRKYNGRLPFSGANTTYNGWSFFGSNLNFLITISTDIEGKELAIEPFTRIYNKYQKDRFFKEKERETLKRYFDAYGINIRYSLMLLRRKS